MLNRHNLELAKLAPKDTSRYTFNGIHVSPERTIVTDGHYLVTVALQDSKSEDFPATEGIEPTDSFPPFILPTDAALDVAKSIPKRAINPIYHSVAIGAKSSVNGTVVMAVPDLDNPRVFQPRKIDGQYPNVDQVIPKREDAKFTISFDLELLSKLTGHLAKMADGKNHEAVFTFTGAESPVRIDLQTTDSQDVVAVLMPVKL